MRTQPPHFIDERLFPLRSRLQLRLPFDLQRFNNTLLFRPRQRDNPQARQFHVGPYKLQLQRVQVRRQRHQRQEFSCIH